MANCTKQELSLNLKVDIGACRNLRYLIGSNVVQDPIRFVISIAIFC